MNRLRQIVFLGGLLLAIGCRREPSAPPVSAATNQTYSVRGVVQAIPPDLRHVTIKHEAIPGYMAAMTMDFSVKDTNELNRVSVGDEITFTLVVTADDDWIENLRRTGKTGAVATPGWSIVEPELEVGDPLPDAEFTSETGRPIRFADFRGRAVAFTFFFTSCPLPEYCPRMNRNFSEAQKILQADTRAPANWQLLSISFDPAFDSPQVLQGYASFYRGTNADRWLFAVASTNTLRALAPRLDFRFWRDNGVLSHNLRTVVVDGAGKISRQFDGNDWTPEQLADAIRAAAKTNAP
jgi:protein SCO1/2